MAVPPQDLKNAILLRHYLSGLRLEYPPLPESDPRVSRVRRLIGLQQSAEELFFDSLYRQSEGVFRSAFELWQHYMERVEGGVLYMREPKEPHYEHMVGQLTLDGALALAGDSATRQPDGCRTTRRFSNVRSRKAAWHWSGWSGWSAWSRSRPLPGCAFARKPAALCTWRCIA